MEPSDHVEPADSDVNELGLRPEIETRDDGARWGDEPMTDQQPVGAAPSEVVLAPLSEIEARIVGCLIEKAQSTPNDYPLSLNAIVRAANQSTSRDPVMNLGEAEVQRSLDGLKPTGWVRFVHPAHGRSVTRFRHVVDEKLGLDAAGQSLLAVLMLRGPQTASELRARTDRLHSFDSTEAVVRALGSLATHEPALVSLLNRVPGQKEQRWVSLIDERSTHGVPNPPPGDDVAGPQGGTGVLGGVSPRPGVSDSTAVLSADVASLRDEVGQLRDELSKLRAALEEALGPVDTRA